MVRHPQGSQAWDLLNFPSKFFKGSRRVIGEYRKRIVKLEIDIEELKVDVKTLASDKTEFLLNFSNIQAQYGQAVGRLQIFEQFHREAQAVSTGKSDDQSGNITEFREPQLSPGVSDLC